MGQKENAEAEAEDIGPDVCVLAGERATNQSKTLSFFILSKYFEGKQSMSHCKVEIKSKILMLFHNILFSLGSFGSLFRVTSG